MVGGWWVIVQTQGEPLPEPLPDEPMPYAEAQAELERLRESEPARTFVLALRDPPPGEEPTRPEWLDERHLTEPNP